MGLDLLNLTLIVEDEFEITIPNERAEAIKTPGQLVDYLLSCSELSKKWSREYVHLSVWMILEEFLGDKRQNYNDDSRFVEDMGFD